jgi:hypothetical protein
MDYSSLENDLRNAGWPESRIREEMDRFKEKVESPEYKSFLEATDKYLKSPEYLESKKAELKIFISTMEAIGIKVPDNTDEENIWGVLEAQCSSDIYLKALIEELKNIGIKNQEFYELPQDEDEDDDFIEKDLIEKFKEMGLEIPQDAKFPKMDLPPLQRYFHGLSIKSTHETDKYLNNLEFKTFGRNQKLTTDEKERWMNIYILSKEYHLDSLIKSSENYRNNKKSGFLTLPICGSDIMSGGQIDFFHYEHLKKYLHGIGTDILGMYFCPRHQILTSQSGDELRFYVYISPSKLSEEIILSCDEGKIQVLSKKDIDKESLEKYLIYCEKNVKNVIREEKIEKYLKQKNGI